MEIHKRDYQRPSRTQASIVNALLRLMRNDDFTALTVKEITSEAGIARSTFYLNYRSKEDVLSSYIEELFTQFTQTIPQEEQADSYLLSLHHFRFWAQHLDTLALLSRHNLFPLLLDKYEAWMAELAQHYPAHHVFGFAVTSSAEEGLLQAFCAAGLWNLLKHWVHLGARETPEEMARMYQRWLSASAT